MLPVPCSVTDRGESREHINKGDPKTQRLGPPIIRSSRRPNAKSNGLEEIVAGWKGRKEIGTKDSVDGHESQLEAEVTRWLETLDR